ncbi:hypothetical protein HS088_TW05G00125 [Tripterygium wilfordii]|uniref:Uncharacterized protein n=1 Tax=Tripterygium wilfordii TaxID=458696 RepID=A0A7J7DMF8_TRIWF|nr:uncharacterized protein LOC119998822 [Tripterygium wilfordii]KAF5747404.1 hypothetical protein HS088_TW05G00125 [Tripterygium wilfordii]
MAELIHHKPKSTNNGFLCCFGFPGRRKQQLSRKKSDAKKNNKTSTLCFTWSRFRIKRSSSTKTVPLDSTVPSENINLSLNCPNPTEEDLPKPLSQITAAATHNQSSKETKINKLHQHRRSSDDATCQKRLSFRRKIDSIRTSSHPASPDTAKPKDRRPNVVISRSTTFPVPDRVKWVGSASTQSQVINEKEFSKLDPIVGFSIVTITLLIMLLWGRLCAIFCTSAWFYFVPRLRSNMDHSGTNVSGSTRPDLDSEEYKKRVVMEGFLQRNNHHHHQQRSTA